MINPVDIGARGLIDQTRPRSPETYFGALRNEFFGNGRPGVIGVQSLDLPKTIQRDTLYLVGDWDIQGEYATNQSAHASIIYRYRGSHVYIVAYAEEDNTVQVLRDGERLGEVKGDDVRVLSDGLEIVPIKEDRLYTIVNGEYGEHTLQLEIDEPGLRLFAFTFG